MSGQALEGWSSTRQQRGRLPDGAAGYLLQPATILRRVASALTESRRRLYPSRCGYLPDTAGGKPATDKVTGSVEDPLPSGYSRHHERAELRRQAHRWGGNIVFLGNNIFLGN